MKEFMYEDEYKELINERTNFLKIYNILKVTPLEIQNNMKKDDIIFQPEKEMERETVD